MFLCELVRKEVSDRIKKPDAQWYVRLLGFGLVGSEVVEVTLDQDDRSTLVTGTGS